MSKGLVAATGALAATGLAAAGIAIGAVGGRSHLTSGVSGWQPVAGTTLPAATKAAVARAAPGASDVAGVSSDDGGFVGVLRENGSTGTMISAVASDPGDRVISVQPFRSLDALTFVNGALAVTSLAQAAAPDGSVGSVYGSGLLAAPAVGVRLGFADGSTQSLATVALGDGVHTAFAFAASAPSAFPTSITASDDTGARLATFGFDPTAHP